MKRRFREKVVDDGDILEIDSNAIAVTIRSVKEGPAGVVTRVMWLEEYNESMGGYGVYE